MNNRVDRFGARNPFKAARNPTHRSWRKQRYVRR
jgi:hypothetical protein